MFKVFYSSLITFLIKHAPTTHDLYFNIHSSGCSSGISSDLTLVPLFFGMLYTLNLSTIRSISPPWIELRSVWVQALKSTELEVLRSTSSTQRLLSLSLPQQMLATITAPHNYDLVNRKRTKTRCRIFICSWCRSSRSRVSRSIITGALAVPN